MSVIKTKIKSLLEAKFVAKPEDMDELMPNLGKDDMVKLVDEANLTEAPAKNDPKVEVYVSKLNQLIASAIDSDGDPIAAVDSSGTAESEKIYLPIVYQNGSLMIQSRNVYSNDFEKEVILKRNMEFDGIPTLKLIKRLYTLAIKRANKPRNPNMEENEHERAGRGIEYGAQDGEVNDVDDRDWEELQKHMNENAKITKQKLSEYVNSKMKK